MTSRLEVYGSEFKIFLTAEKELQIHSIQHESFQKLFEILQNFMSSIIIALRIIFFSVILFSSKISVLVRVLNQGVGNQFMIF